MTSSNVRSKRKWRNAIRMEFADMNWRGVWRVIDRKSNETVAIVLALWLVGIVK